MKTSLRTRLRNAVDAFRRGTLQPVLTGLASLATAIGDWFSGAWQQVNANPTETEVRSALSVAAVYDCIRRIATDIAKMSPGIRYLESSGVWVRGKHQVFSRLIVRPNHFQTWFQFMVCWVSSRLLAGNAYIIKLYRGALLDELIVLDPTRVEPLVASDSGRVFYRVQVDPLLALQEDMVVPSDQVIHDRYLPLGHPLIGTSPLERALVAARARGGIIRNTADLNEHASVPPGVLTVPEGLSDADMKELADKWRQIPKGRIAVLDAAYKFEPLAAKYVDSQSQELADLSGTDICIAFGMPPWKLGIGTRPTGEPEALQIIYYQDCLQWQVEEIEQCLDHGLALPADLYVELDPQALLRMDSKTKAEVAKILGSAGILAPNEGRAWFDMQPVPGGHTPYLQQQNYSLAALHARDQMAPAPAGGSGGNPPQPAGDDPDEPGATTDDEDETDATARVPSLPWAGVYDAAKGYPKGVTVTHKRGLWLALNKVLPGDKPGVVQTGASHWLPKWQLIAGYNKPVPGVEE